MSNDLKFWPNAEIGVGYEKVDFGVRTKAVISETQQDRTILSLLLTTNRKYYTRFRLCQNQRPWMTLTLCLRCDHDTVTERQTAGRTDDFAVAIQRLCVYRAVKT